MSREKQIDEMAKLICAYPQCIHHNIIGECANTECPTVDIAENLYSIGYRKASEVAEDIVRMLRAAGINEWRYPIVADIKKKYLESEKDDER